MNATGCRSLSLRRGLSALLLVGTAVVGSSQGADSAATAPTPSAGKGGSTFPCPESEIARYTAYRIQEPIHIDGQLDEPVWRQAPQSPRFVDILTGAPALHSTRAMVVWDDTHLYVAYRVEEPLVHAKFTAHNDPIYYDNDVEFFIAGKDAYRSPAACESTAAATSSILDRFDASVECREVTCLYHDTNWWLEKAIEDGGLDQRGRGVGIVFEKFRRA
mgnify:CR=1 FL=1